MGRDDDGVDLVVEPHADIDELARPQRVVVVVELRAQADCAGARIDRVVDEDQSPQRMLLRRVDGQHLDLQRALGHALAHFGQVLLGHREVDVDRPHLVDHHQRVDVVRPD